jgi:6-phosphogluconolactonase
VDVTRLIAGVEFDFREVMFSKKLASTVLVLVVAILTACGGGGEAASNTGSTPIVTFSVGGVVKGLGNGTSIELQSNGKDTLSISANGAFAFPTTMHNGETYNISVSNQRSTTTFCAISNGIGTVASANVTSVNIACGPAHYAYVANYYANSVSQYVYGPGGALTHAPIADVSTGSNPTSTALNPSAPYLYVINSKDNSISQFSIGAAGALAPISAQTVSTGSGPSSIAIDPTGHYAYVPNVLGHSIYQYSIDANGGLVPMAIPMVALGTSSAYLRRIVIDPTGHFVYVLSDHGVLQFAIGAQGALTLLDPSPVTAIGLIMPVSIAASGNNVYVVYRNGTAQYSIGGTGLLSPLATSSVDTGSSAAGIAIDSAGKFSYVVNQPSMTGSPIAQYTIGVSGALTAMPTPSINSGANPSFMTNCITADATGMYVYVANMGSILQYSIGANGALSTMQTPSIATANGSISIVTK